MSLLAFAGPNYELQAQRAGLLSSALLASGRPLIEKVNAAGLLSLPHSHNYRPPWMRQIRQPQDLVVFLAANSDLLPLEPKSLLPISETPIVAPIAQMLGESPEWLKEVFVWAIPSPIPQVNRGAGIVQSQTGTAGFAISWNGGHGYVTAGHVAQAGGGVVRLANGAPTPLGNVIVSHNPAGHGNAPLPDVAIVQDVPSNHQPSTIKLSAGQRGDRVSIITSRGVLSDVICAYTDAYYSTPANCCFANVHQTEGGVTQGGDSGSAAVHENTGEAIGSVVAGRHGFVTLLQDVAFQLRATGLANILLN